MEFGRRFFLGSSSSLFTELDLSSNHTSGDGLGLRSGVDGWMFSMVILGLGISMFRLFVLVRVRSLDFYLGGFFVINRNFGQGTIWCASHAIHTCSRGDEVFTTSPFVSFIFFLVATWCLLLLIYLLHYFIAGSSHAHSMARSSFL